MADYGHDLLFGTFLTPQNAEPHAPVALAQLSERAGLAAGGLITRTVRDGPPVAVSYQLTERGRALMPALDLIARWARDNLPPGNC